MNESVVFTSTNEETEPLQEATLPTDNEGEVGLPGSLRYQMTQHNGPIEYQILEALVDHSVGKRDSMTTMHPMHHDNNASMTKARCFAQEISSGPFIMSVVVWYNVLFHINRASKIFQSSSWEWRQSEIKHMQKFRENGFVASRTDAQEIANKVGVELVFPEQRRQKKRSMFAQESSDDGPAMLPEETYKQNVFLPLVDAALISLTKRYSQLDIFTNCSEFFSAPGRCEQ